MVILPSAPVNPSGRVIYDAIMGKIEPELVSQNLFKLDELSSRGTKKERSARKRRYVNALRKYRDEYEKYLSSLRQAVRRFERDARRFAESESKRLNDDPFLKSVQPYFN